MLYQYLYTRYSHLQFSHSVDRPVAIAGLENRLIRDLNIRGGFGVLDDERHGLLRRSLLWRRAEGQLSLTKIDFRLANELRATVPTPPSWSWMAYEGPIEYMDLPFNQVHWDERSIVSPWSNSPLETWSYGGDRSTVPLGLNVLARRFDDEKRVSMFQEEIVMLDDPQVTKLGLECVILGRLDGLVRQDSRDEQIYFVILVSVDNLQSEIQGLIVYHRVGVGSVPGRVICWDGEGTRGVLQ